MQNKGFPADFLYQLKQRSDIVSIVSRYTRLDKKGSRYWGCCPFHNEKTPSFSVMQDEGQFYCFGCKEYGDVISFVQKIESCEFMDAVKILAEQAHMEMPKITASDDDTHKRAKEKERLLALLDATWKHYHENLYLPQAKPAQDYIKSRNFTRHELDDFKIGYSLNWNEMIDYLKGKGFTIKEMEDAGVAQSKDGRAYDVGDWCSQSSMHLMTVLGLVLAPLRKLISLNIKTPLRLWSFKRVRWCLESIF